MSSVFGGAHPPDCMCSVHAAQRVQDTERLSSTDRLAWCESRILQLQDQILNISKGRNQMGYALWCQKGGHSFDENDPQAERMTVDVRDENGKKTGEEKTVHMCGRHAAEAFRPTPRSLAAIQQELDEATEIGE